MISGEKTMSAAERVGSMVRCAPQTSQLVGSDRWTNEQRSARLDVARLCSGLLLRRLRAARAGHQHERHQGAADELSMTADRVKRRPDRGFQL